MFYAHVSDDGRKEFLEDHGKLTYNVATDKLLPYAYRIIRKTFDDKRLCDFLCDAAGDALYIHDEGKKNPYVQCINMKNMEYAQYTNGNTNHSYLGAIQYLVKWIKKLEQDDYLSYQCWPDVEYILYLFSYVIARHHSSLQNFDITIYVSELGKYTKNKDFYIGMDYSLGDVEKTVNGKILIGQSLLLSKNKQKNIFALGKFMHSLLCYSDFIATSLFMQGKEKMDSIASSLSQIKVQYQKNNIVNLYNESTSSPVNKIRTQIYIESEQRYISNPDKQIYYLSAPCGTGKTNSAINIMLKDAEHKHHEKLFFVFPFNTISKQTSDIFSGFIEYNKDYFVKNSVTAIARKEDCDDEDWDEMLIRYQFLEYPICITSHVAFFDILTGTSKMDNISLCQLAGSTVGLDEIHAYPVHLWNEMAELLTLFADLLDITFVISSATLPKLDVLLKDGHDRFYNLLNTDFHCNPVLKNRVKYDYSLLDIDDPTDEIIRMIGVLHEQHKSVMIEFIKISTAEKFYGMLSALYDNVEIVTGNTGKKKRDEIIKHTKTEKLILVCTQVFENGCNICMDIGFQNVNTLEGAVQLAGRVGRNGGVQGTVYLFCVDNPSIHQGYKNDIRIKYNPLSRPESREYLESMSFTGYYDTILGDIYQDRNLCNKASINVFMNQLRTLQFEDVHKTMKLINSDTLRVFIVENDEARQLYMEYDSLIHNRSMAYAKKKILLSELNEQMDEYTMNVYRWQLDNESDNNQFNQYDIRKESGCYIFLFKSSDT